MADENRGTRSQPEPEITFFRRPRTSGRISLRPSSPNVKLSPNAAAKLLQLYFREVSKRHTSSPIADERSPRKALRRVPRRSVVDDGNLPEEYLRVQERIRRRRDISTVREAEGSVSIAGDIAARSEHGRISTTRLRRLVMARLPPSSVLREVLLAESEKLSVEEFLAKLDIWLLLFRKDTEG